MLRIGLIANLAFAALMPTRAAATLPQAACVEAAAVAERNWQLPSDLIRAIGRVESSRLDRDSGRVSSWPWTVNANGSGYWFDSLAEAVAFVRTLQARGIRLIDVGCFQVDLFYHPGAFSSLEQAFDPGANADYAARFLTVLHDRTGSWPAAIAGYHSGRTVEGENYRQKVMNQWGSGGVLVAAATRPVAVEALHSHSTPDRYVADRYVVLMSATARAIAIIRP
jgi:soluble lytic murein transglycosylase-like protein